MSRARAIRRRPSTASSRELEAPVGEQGLPQLGQRLDLFERLEALRQGRAGLLAIAGGLQHLAEHALRRAQLEPEAALDAELDGLAREGQGVVELALGEVQQRADLRDVGQREGAGILPRGREGERPVQHPPSLVGASDLEGSEAPPGGPEHDGGGLADLPRQGQAFAGGAQHVVPASEVEVRLPFHGSPRFETRVALLVGDCAELPRVGQRFIQVPGPGRPASPDRGDGQRLLERLAPSAPYVSIRCPACPSASA